jgi:6,7-dimethyl-8-ribityllumazine synthase
MATSNKNLSAYDKENMINGADLKIGIVVSEWNHDITSKLCEGAIETLTAHNVSAENIDIQKVPGAFELPLGAQFLLKSKQYDGIIAIGTVIQGETKHFDFVCQGTTEGIMRVMLDFNTPISFCVLTDNTIEQSIARSGGLHGNKGIEAAVSLLQMIKVNKSLL